MVNGDEIANVAIVVVVVALVVDLVVLLAIALVVALVVALVIVVAVVVVVIVVAAVVVVVVVAAVVVDIFEIDAVDDDIETAFHALDYAILELIEIVEIRLVRVEPVDGPTIEFVALVVDPIFFEIFVIAVNSSIEIVAIVVDPVIVVTRKIFVVYIFSIVHSHNR